MRRGRVAVFWQVVWLTALLVGGCPNVGSGGGTSGTGSTGTGSTTAGTATTGSSGSSTSNFSDCTAPVTADAWQAEVLRLVNEERAKVGLAALTYNATLQTQAAAYACDMVHYHFFAHVNPVDESTLGERAQEFGYAYWAIGENLAAGQPTPAKAMEDWMSSPGHRENILNTAFTELGVAVRSGGDYGTYWVQEFGRPRSAGPVPTE